LHGRDPYESPPNAEIKTTLSNALRVLSLGSIAPMTPGEQKETSVATNRRASEEETQIRMRLEDWAAAFRRKDIDALMPVFAPDVVSFDIVPPLAYRGREAYRKQWERLFASYPGPIEYEMRDLSIAAEHDVAFSHSLNRIGGTLKNGQKTGFWLRMTACWRRVHGQWLVEHEHVSVPVDLEKGKPALDLAP
jgi:uncharacterized protein (TIGR02246 family)